jgi:starch phosphorylase
MRILVDEHDLEWDEAWASPSSASPTRATPCCPRRSRCGRSSCSWSGCCRGTWRSSTASTRSSSTTCARPYPGDELRVRRMSIIADHPERSVRMAHLATVGSVKVNGVAELHSQLLKDKVLPDFSELWPDRFTNVTNGVTPRRFIKLANPELSRSSPRQDRPGVGDRPRPAARARPVRRRPGVHRRSSARQAENKVRLADVLKKRDGIGPPAGTPCSTRWSSACTSTSASRSRSCTS